MGKITAGAGSTKKAEMLRYRYRLARLVLLIATVFGGLNAAFALIDHAVFYSRVAFVLPYGLMLDGLFWTGKLYAPCDYEAYFGMTAEDFLHQDTIYLYVVCALIAVVVLLVCWALSKKHAWALIAGCAVMALDCVFVISFLGLSLNVVTELVMHALMLVVMIMGIVAHFRLKYMEWSGETVQPFGKKAEAEAAAPAPSPVLHPMDYGAKSKVLLACDVQGYAVCYRSQGRFCELAVNRMVYDTVDAGRYCQPHELCAYVDGHEIAVELGSDSVIYVRFDGEVITKKPR